MKKAVVTICCGAVFERLAALTHPTIEAYARRLGADFIVWRDFAGHTLPHYQKLELGPLLDQYDRVLYVDTDILVRDDTPDLFELVPEGQLGIFDEGAYADVARQFIQFMLAVGYDAQYWDGRYFNTGVMVLSKNHRNLFVRPARELNHFREQSYLNVMIALTRAEVFSLPYRFNRSAQMDWETGDDRRDAFLLHYSSFFGNVAEADFLQQVTRDLAAWEQARPAYRFPRHLAFVLGGGLHEHLAAEPAIRHARESLHAGDDLIVVTSRPELFRHLGLPIYPRIEDAPGGKYYRRLSNLPPAERREIPRLDPRRVHPVTLAALHLLGGDLPTAARQPRLPLDAAALEAARTQLAPREPGQCIVVHPARHGGGTPDEWRACVQALAARGLSVVIVGTTGDDDLAIVEFDRTGCLDLVDRMSLEEIAALMSQAGGLVTNASPLLHVAGACDVELALAFAPRHPDYLLPWRRESQSWRARVVNSVDQLQFPLPPQHYPTASGGAVGGERA